MFQVAKFLSFSASVFVRLLHHGRLSPSLWDDYLEKPMTYFGKVGGESVGRRFVPGFYERVFRDVRFDVYSDGSDKHRRIEAEYHFIAKGLGAGVAYDRRPGRNAHAQYRISGGQIERWHQLLTVEIDALGIPTPVVEAWGLHSRSPRSAVLGGHDHRRGHPVKLISLESQSID